MSTKKVDLVAALKAMPGVTAPVMAEKVEAMANYSHCLTKVHRIIARVCRGWSKKFAKKNPISDKFCPEMSQNEITSHLLHYSFANKI